LIGFARGHRELKLQKRGRLRIVKAGQELSRHVQLSSEECLEDDPVKELVCVLLAEPANVLLVRQGRAMPIAEGSLSLHQLDERTSRQTNQIELRELGP